MFKIHREANTDYLFPGFMERALECFNIPEIGDVDIFFEPEVKGKIYFSQDWRIEDQTQSGNIDFCFYTQPSYRKDIVGVFGKKCALVTYAADPNFYKPIEKEKEYDVGFVGKFDGDERGLYLNAIKNAGYSWCFKDNASPVEMVEILNNSKILINFIRYVDVNLRFFETMALGCQLVNYNPTLDEFATNGLHYVGFSGINHMLYTLKNLLKDQDRINKISLNARSHFLSNHTYSHRAQSVINHLKEFYVQS